VLAHPQGFARAHSGITAGLLTTSIEKRAAKGRQNILERGTEDLNPNTPFPGTPITGTMEQLGN